MPTPLPYDPTSQALYRPEAQPPLVMDSGWSVDAIAAEFSRLAYRRFEQGEDEKRQIAEAIEAAGYRVIGSGDDCEADIAIAEQGSGVSGETAKTIWLRSDPETSGKKDDSIYRYDRAGLLMALKSVGSGSGK